MNHTDKERRKILRQELKDYISTRKVTPDDLKELREWIRSGHSVYENPWFIYGENGWPLDFLAAAEAAEDLEERMRAGEIVWPVDEYDSAMSTPLE